MVNDIQAGILLLLQFIRDLGEKVFRRWRWRKEDPHILSLFCIVIIIVAPTPDWWFWRYWEEFLLPQTGRACSQYWAILPVLWRQYPLNWPSVLIPMCVNDWMTLFPLLLRFQTGDGKRPCDVLFIVENYRLFIYGPTSPCYSYSINVQFFRCGIDYYCYWNDGIFTHTLTFTYTFLPYIPHNAFTEDITLKTPLPIDPIPWRDWLIL